MADDKLEKTASMSMTRPSFIPVGDEGTEHITREDLQIPRLALAQGLTPQVTAGLEGFSVGMLFNSISNKIYGKGPIYFYILRADKPRFIEFYPRETGGGVKDMNVAAGDPRTQFTVGPQGQSIKPAATKFYDYFILMEPFTPDNFMEQLIALSFKSSGLKMARQLNMFIKQRQTPIWSGRYVMRTKIMTNAKGTFAVYDIDNAGWPPDDETMHLLKSTYESLKDRQVIVHYESAGGDDSFDAETLEREAEEARQAPRM